MSFPMKQLLGRAKRMIPPMLESFHKGQLGRVGVLGGSESFTGAPYFSAMASARLGCDMSHVICTPAAAAVIKTYSPDLMVHPLMRQTPAPSGFAAPAPEDSAEAIAGRIAESLLPRLHVLVIGPGLGRDPLMLDTVAHVIRSAREKGLAIVIDADALGIIGDKPDVIRGYRLAVLTPNVVEFGRLCRALGIGEEVEKEAKEGASAGRRVEMLARKLGGVTIVQKGGADVISDGEQTLTSDLQGGKKRSGGQGDTLTGTVGTFLAWRKAYVDKLWDDSEAGGKDEGRLGEHETVGLAAFAGSVITRECSRQAFARKGRSLQASDLTDEVHGAFMRFFGDLDGEGAAKL